MSGPPPVRTIDHSIYDLGTLREREIVLEDLKSHGVCLLDRSDMRPRSRLCDDAMDVAEERRFALSRTTKLMTSTSSNEEGYVSAPHKEMFLFTEQSGAVQKPEYWHLPTAPGACFSETKALGMKLFRVLNKYGFPVQHAFAFEHDATTIVGSTPSRVRPLMS